MSDQEQGFADGKSAGTWVFDGNTDQRTYAAILKGIEDGDPMVLDGLPQPPADSSDEYALAYSSGVQDEVTRAARYQLYGDE